ncbi:hypothetical protein [Kibdelosporangium philippinense]|uniref:hypothetical protein n=1 Tax=Kibdelosporangium philippinense TaxID=211113 RepID=UPI0036215B29
MVDTREGGAMREAPKCKPRKRKEHRRKKTWPQAKVNTAFSNGGHGVQQRWTRSRATVDTV